MLGKMSYRWVEHTGELELKIEAATEEGVFSDALTAIAELLDEDRQRRSGRKSQHLASLTPGRRG